jgi:hypothetical protein
MTITEAQKTAREMVALIADADNREINAHTELEIEAARAQRASAYSWLREARAILAA